MTEIFLDIEGSLPRLRQWVADLQTALGDDGRIRHSLEDGDDGDDGDDGEHHYKTIYVDVFDAASEVDALERVQPIKRELEVDDPIVQFGTGVWRLVLPAS